MAAFAWSEESSAGAEFLDALSFTDLSDTVKFLIVSVFENRENREDKQQ